MSSLKSPKPIALADLKPPKPRERCHHKGHTIPEAVPRYATRRRPERSSFGALACMVAVWLGKPLMPWQVEIAYTILEYRKRPNGGIEFYYNSWFYTVPRQQGKTLLAFVWMITRCMTTPGGNFAWTAQNQTKAAAKWLKEFYPAFRASAELNPVGRCYETNGKEKIKFKNGATMAVAGSAGDDNHGDTLNGAGCDEIWAIDASIMAGLLHALSRPDSQMGKFSTAGDEGSEFYDREVEAGRAAAEADTGEGAAYWEYSAEVGTDPHDQESWYEFMPALGHETTVRTVQTALDEAVKHDTVDDWIRAYHNIPDTSAVSELIDGDIWEESQVPWSSKLAKKADSLALGVHVNFDRTRAVVSVCVDEQYLGVLEEFDGTAGVAKFCNRLTKKHDCEVFLDGTGPAASIKGMRRRRKLKGDDIANGCASFLDAANGAELHVRPSVTLTEAVGAARKRKVGNRWVWVDDERATPLWSATLAYVGAVTAAAESLDLNESGDSIYSDSDFELIVF